MIRALPGLLVLLCLCACASSPSPYVQHSPSTENTRTIRMLSLKVAGDPDVKFIGEVNNHDPGDPNHGMMYYANSGAGLLAGIFAHALVQGASDNQQEKEIQANANKVLDPYRSLITRISGKSLADTALGDLHTEGRSNIRRYEAQGQDEWIMETLPVFVMTQDRSTLFLQNAIMVYSAGNASSPTYQNMIEVFSAPPAGETETFWSTGSTPGLIRTSQTLFSESIRLAMEDFYHRLPQKAAEKTFRYSIGKEVRFERGSLANEKCDRVAIRTLRGWLKSVPKSETAKHPQCKDAMQYPG